MRINELEGQVGMFDQDSWYGRTSLEPLAPTAAKTSKPSSRRSSGSQTPKLPMCLCLTRTSGQSQDASMMRWEDGQLLGAYTMHSFGESPNEENESRLSQILVDSPHPKYSLSAKACVGILNRAEKRGKALPPELKEALERQANECDELHPQN